MKLICHLAQHRARLGITQAGLAEAIGVSRKTINTVENGVFVPSTVLSLKLARFFDVSVHDLFALPDEETQASVHAALPRQNPA